MRSVLIILALIMTAWLSAAQAARAQQRSMPQRYNPISAGPSYGLPEALPPPTVANPESDNAVSIPIPGGGQITVEGPAAPVRNPLPPLGGDTWSVHQGAPNNPGTGPAGPIQ